MFFVKLCVSLIFFVAVSHYANANEDYGSDGEELPTPQPHNGGGGCTCVSLLGGCDCRDWDLSHFKSQDKSESSDMGYVMIIIIVSTYNNYYFSLIPTCCK